LRWIWLHAVAFGFQVRFGVLLAIGAVDLNRTAGVVVVQQILK